MLRGDGGAKASIYDVDTLQIHDFYQENMM